MNKNSELGRKLTRKYTVPLPSSPTKKHLTTKNALTINSTKQHPPMHQKMFKSDQFDELTMDIVDKMKTIVEKGILPIIQVTQGIQEAKRVERKAIPVLIKHQWGFSESLPFATLQSIITTDEDTELSDEEKAVRIHEELVQAFMFLEKEGLRFHPSLAYARESLEKQLGYGWDYIAEELYDHVTYHRKYSAIPLMFIMMERLMVNLHETHIEQNQRDIIESFQDKMKSKNQDIKYMVNYEGYARMFNAIIKPKIFGRAEHDDPPEGILNRHLVVHGKSDPSTWTNTDMYKLLTVLFGMAETIDAYAFITSEIETEHEAENE